MNNELTEEDFVQLFLLCVQDGRNDVLWNSMKAMGYSMEFDFPMEFPEIVLRSDQTVEFSPEGRSFLVNVKIVTIFDLRYSVASLM